MEGSLNELSLYRYQTGLEDLEDAKLMFEHGRYKNALNRSYYAIFHAIKSVIVLDGFDGSKHGRVIAYFNQKYVKTGIFGIEMSVIIKEAYENREKADYLDFFIASREDAQKQIEKAEVFLERVKVYLKEKNVPAE